MISIGYITARYEPHFRWFFDSLAHQVKNGDDIEVIICDAQHGESGELLDYPFNIFLMEPKPTIWQGKHRLTKSDYWAKSNALNSFLCRARGGFIAGVDDRCVLAPSWLDSVRAAMEGNYAVCGAYEKFHHMVVENGIMSSGVEPVDEFGRKTGKDHRITGHLPRARHCIPGWFFGCSFALPTEWALQVNGWNELLDGLSAEDTHFGHMLANNGFDIRFDPRMKVLQDRTPGECGPEMKRDSRERFQHDTQDKGHEAIRRFFGEKMSSHHWNIREIRDKVLAGGSWPTLENAPTRDWFDGKFITEFE